MERLTEWRGEHAAVVNHHVNYIDRLAAYEDIGLTPEEIVATLINYSTFLYEMTGGRMSKTNYTVKAMISAAKDRFQSICDECRAEDHAAELLDAEVEGRLVVLPCKVGDTVYRICREYKKGNPFIKAVTFNQNNFWRIVFCGEFGKTVFLTREEADAALKGEGHEN